MRIRHGFVSNSSSSCFTCEACGRKDGGYDIHLSDVFMVECINDHLFCEDELDEKVILSQYDSSTKTTTEVEYANLKGAKSYADWRYSISPKSCPVCSLKVIPSHTINMYLIHKHREQKSSIEKEIRHQFRTLKELEKFCTK